MFEARLVQPTLLRQSLRHLQSLSFHPKTCGCTALFVYSRYDLIKGHCPLTSIIDGTSQYVKASKRVKTAWRAGIHKKPAAQPQFIAVATGDIALSSCVNVIRELYLTAGSLSMHVCACLHNSSQSLDILYSNGTRFYCYVS
jgi:hypothetical protein